MKTVIKMKVIIACIIAITLGCTENIRETNIFSVEDSFKAVQVETSTSEDIDVRNNSQSRSSSKDMQETPSFKRVRVKFGVESMKMKPWDAYIITIDSCEYVAWYGGLTHKGNCKFCIERNKNEKNKHENSKN